jgi:hypothetical protein
MKTKSVCKPAIVTPRGLFGFGPGSIGALLALLVFAAWPSSSALAIPDPCEDVEFSQYTYSDVVYVSMYADDCAGGKVFYTLSGLNPTHNQATPGSGTYVYTQPVPVTYGHCKDFLALAWKPSAHDSNITDFEACNYPP